MGSVTEPASVDRPVSPFTFGWALKRALLGFAILFVTMGAVAWLTYASIDPTLEDPPAATPAENPHAPLPTQIRL